jgi:hypothetical protein
LSVVERIRIHERAETVDSHGAVVARICVRVSADIRVGIVRIGFVRDSVVVVVRIARVAGTIRVHVAPVVCNVVDTARAVIASVRVQIAADQPVQRVAVGAVRNSVVVVVGVAHVAQAVEIGIDAVVVRSVDSARAILAGVGVDIAAKRRVERGGVLRVGSSIVVVIGIAEIAQTIGVRVEPVVEHVVDAARTIVAVVGIGISADVRIQLIEILRVVDTVVIVVRIARVAQTIVVRIESVVSRVGDSARAILAAVVVEVAARAGIQVVRIARRIDAVGVRVNGVRVAGVTHQVEITVGLRGVETGRTVVLVAAFAGQTVPIEIRIRTDEVLVIADIDDEHLVTVAVDHAWVTLEVVKREDPGNPCAEVDHRRGDRQTIVVVQRIGEVRQHRHVTVGPVQVADPGRVVRRLIADDV